MKKGKRISLLISTVVFFCTIEVCARIDDGIRYRAPLFNQYSAELMRTSDSEGINCNVPKSRFEKWRINSLGFRGPDIQIPKAKNTVRIICMGTSETFGLYESPGKEWPAQLGNILKKHHRFHVINTSVVGLPLKKFRRYLEKYVLRLQPDIVILYVNPFGYAVSGGKFFERQEAGMKDEESIRKQRRLCLTDFTSNLRMLPKVKEAIKRIVPHKLLQKYRILNMKKQLHALEVSHLKGRKPIDFVPERCIDRFQDDMDEVIEFLQNRNVDVILASYPVLITPENVEKHIEVFLDYRRFYVELSLNGIIAASRKFNEVIKNVSEEWGVPFIDNNATLPKTTQYFADNVHYTDEGAAIVASNFANCVHGLFPQQRQKNSH